MEDDFWWKMIFDGRLPLMDLNNEDNLKNKEDLHISGRHPALDIFRFAVFFFTKMSYQVKKFCPIFLYQIFKNEYFWGPKPN